MNFRWGMVFLTDVSSVEYEMMGIDRFMPLGIIQSDEMKGIMDAVMK